MTTLQKVTEGGHIKKFYHPYMNCLSVFVANLINFIVYKVNEKTMKSPLEEGKTLHKNSIFFVPALIDVLSTILQMTALNLISGSTYLLIKGSSVIVTVFFTKYVFKMKV